MGILRLLLGLQVLWWLSESYCWTTGLHIVSWLLQWLCIRLLVSASCLSFFDDCPSAGLLVSASSSRHLLASLCWTDGVCVIPRLLLWLGVSRLDLWHRRCYSAPRTSAAALWLDSCCLYFYPGIYVFSRNTFNLLWLYMQWEEDLQNEEGSCQFLMPGEGGVKWNNLHTWLLCLWWAGPVMAWTSRDFRAFFLWNSFMQNQSPGWMLWHSLLQAGDWTALTQLCISWATEVRAEQNYIIDSSMAWRSIFFLRYTVVCGAVIGLLIIISWGSWGLCFLMGEDLTDIRARGSSVVHSSSISAHSLASLFL